MTRCLTLLFSIVINCVLSQTSYRPKSFDELQQQRQTRFYSKAIDQLSKKTLYINQTSSGLGVFANNELISGSPLLEIIDEYGICSFDSIFPDHKKIRDSFHNIPLSPDDQDMIMLIFNIMYYRYSKRTLNKSRFMKIFHDNIPNLNYYTPTWENIEQEVFYRLINKTNHFDFKNELFSKDNPVINYIISYKVDIIRENGTRYLEMINWENIKTAANIAYSRSLPISYKSWKEFIGVAPEKISENDSQKTGFIVLAGFDVINHDHNAPLINLKLKKHKIIINSGKRYRKDEEILINYPFKTTNDFFKAYSFVPNNVYQEHIPQKLDTVSLYSFSHNETIFKVMCYLLDACKTETDFNPNLSINVPYYPKYIFNYYLFKRIIYNWQDGQINNDTIKQTVDMIKSKEYSNLTLAISLSSYLDGLSESLSYLFEEGYSFERLIEWYEATFDKNFDINKFLTEIRIDIPSKLPLDFKIKIRETVRFAIYFYHNTLLGFRESVNLLNKTLDVLTDELKERIIDRY